MRNATVLTILLGLLLSTSLAYSQVSQQVRCNTDSLSIDQALARLDWMRRCALSRLQPANGFLMTFPGVGDFPEYSEGSTTTQHFVGAEGVHDKNGVYRSHAINSAYQKSRFVYGTPGGAVPLVVNGKTYQIWTQHLSDPQKPQPMYPAFGTSPDPAQGEQLWPSGNATDCRLYTDMGTVSTVHYVTGYCTASCYTPEQKILFATSSNGGLPPNSRHGRYERIIDAFDQLLPRVMTLTTQSTLERFSLRPGEVSSYTTELYDSDHEIFEIQTAHGSLRLTGEHPVLRSDGRIVFAKDLKSGDELIRVDGSFDPIKQISTTVHHGKVYNLRPSSSNLLENILVAQDYLVGSSQYQNDYVIYVNRVILNHAVPASVLPTRARGR